MAELNEVGLVDGVPNTGTGEAPTLAPVRNAIGLPDVAMADAGGEGSVSGKMRRATSQLEAVKAASEASQAALEALAALIDSGDLLVKDTAAATLLGAIGTLLSGTLAVSGTVTANTGLSQPLTDTELRATPVPVSGPLTDTELRASSVPVLPSPGVAANAADTANPLKVGGRYDSTTPTYDNGDVTNFQADVRGSQHVVLRQPGADAAISAGDLANDGLSTASIGITTRALGYMYNGSGHDRMRGDTTNGLLASPPGMSVFRSLDLDETEEDVKTSAGKLYKLRITNFATAPVYVKLYNATAANVTVGTTTPIDTIVVPAASASDACVITENFGGRGLIFSTALSLAAVTGLADNNTGAPATNACVVSAYYD